MSLQVPKVLNYFRDVILRRDMDKDSALLLNAGAHYVKVFSLIIFACYFYMKLGYLTIIPRARLGSESIVTEWAIDHTDERNNCFSKIQQVGQKYRR